MASAMNNEMHEVPHIPAGFTRGQRGGRKGAKEQVGTTKNADGTYATNKDGIELCRNFQRGMCKHQANGRSNACGADSSRKHQCAICLRSDHGANWHDKPTTTDAVVKNKLKKNKTRKP